MNNINYDHLTAEELINAVDRSDPQVKALAVMLEKYVNAAVTLTNAIETAVADFDAEH